MLQWLDKPGHYWAISLTILFVTTLVAMSPAFVKARIGITRCAFIGLLFLTLVAGRWPVFLTSQTLEYDESFNVAMAMTAAEHPVPWKSWDPATVGPLEVLFLVIPKLFGISIGYNSTHVMTVFALWGMLTFLFLFLRRFIDEGMARIAVLPALVFLTFAFSGEFEHYASEIFSLLLLSIALFCAALPTPDRRTALRAAILTGAFLGAVPFAKTQAAPLAALVAMCYLARLCWRREASVRPMVIAFGGGLVAIPLAILAIVGMRGALADFWYSYIRMQANYIAGPGPAFSFLFFDSHFSEFVLVTLSGALIAAAAAAAIGQRKTSSTRERLLPALCVAFGAVSLFVIFAPHKPWIHYVFFLVPALTLLTGAFLGELHASVDGLWKRVAIVAAALMVVPLVRESLRNTLPYVGSLVAIRQSLQPLHVRIIRDLTHPGDRMAMWGLDSDLYPATGLIMGTRENNSYFQMTPNPLLDYFQGRYIKDIIANTPRFFVDSVAPGAVVFTDRKASGFETFPALAAVVAASYRLVCDVQGVRIYQRRIAAESATTATDCPERPNHVVLSAIKIKRLQEISAPHAPGFIDSLSSAAGPATGNVFPAGSAISANGWAFDPQTGKPGAGLFLIVDGKMRIDVTAAYGQDRPDVAATLKLPGTEYSGFASATIAGGTLRSGAHTVAFGVLSADRKMLYLSNGNVAFTVR